MAFFFIEITLSAGIYFKEMICRVWKHCCFGRQLPETPSQQGWPAFENGEWEDVNLFLTSSCNLLWAVLKMQEHFLVLWSNLNMVVFAHVEWPPVRHLSHCLGMYRAQNLTYELWKEGIVCLLYKWPTYLFPLPVASKLTRVANKGPPTAIPSQKGMMERSRQLPLLTGKAMPIREENGSLFPGFLKLHYCIFIPSV